MKNPSRSKVQAALEQAHFDLAYANAGFNIHDCSDSMHRQDEEDHTIETLFDLCEDGCSKEFLNACRLSYIRGYAQYALDHDVFEETPTSTTNEAAVLTRVCENTAYDFNESDEWETFCKLYQEALAARNSPSP